MGPPKWPPSSGTVDLAIVRDDHSTLLESISPGPRRFMPDACATRCVRGDAPLHGPETADRLDAGCHCCCTKRRASRTSTAPLGCFQHSRQTMRDRGIASASTGSPTSHPPCNNRPWLLGAGLVTRPCRLRQWPGMIVNPPRGKSENGEAVGCLFCTGAGNAFGDFAHQQILDDGINALEPRRLFWTVPKTS
ncbi:hypothetical protein GGI35DRAFT_323888 [Trichoderma velutinum]